jgi:hypothetical protein
MILVFVLVALVLFGGIGLAIYLLKRRAKLSAGPTLADTIRALQVVWADIYGMDFKLAPLLTWVTRERLDCLKGRGWLSDEGCVAGLSWRETNRSAVAWPAGTSKFSDTAFAHELRHAAAWHNVGLNNDHFSGEFQGDVAVANGKLREAGL